MPPIPRLISRRITPSGRVGDLPIPSDIADVGIEGRGLAALGRGVSNLGVALSQIQQDQQRLIDFEADSKALALISSTNNQINAELLETDNKREEGQPSAYEQRAAKIYDENIVRYFEETQMSIRQQRIVRAKLEAGKSRAVSSALFASAKKTANTAWAALEIETIESYASLDLEKQREAKEKFDEMSIIKFSSSSEGKRVAKAKWDEWVAKGMKYGNDAIKDAYRVAALAMGEEGVAWIVKPENTPGITQEDRFEIQSEVNASLRITERRDREALMETTHQEYWKDLRQDALSILQNKVDASDLPATGDGGKKWWTQLIASRRKEIIKNLEVKTDGVERGNLLTEVYNISIGTTTKRKFQQKLLEKRYTELKLNDSAFDDLWLKSETEFKSWRAAQLQKSLRAIRAQIITIDESTMERMIGILRGEALAEITTRRQGEEDKYAEAVKEMDDWLAANPEPTRDEFYKEQRRLLRDYRNKTAEQIRQGRAEFKEIQTIQPTEEQLKAQAAATNNTDERRRIYEQGRELGYWR